MGNISQHLSGKGAADRPADPAAAGAHAARHASATWRTSLRLRLLLLVLLAVLPAFGLISWTAYEDREVHLQEAEHQAERVARLEATVFGKLVDFTHETLARLADDPQVRAPTDPQACGLRLAEARKLNPAYGLLGVIGLDGRTVCAAEPRAVGVDLADRDYFKQAVATRQFVVSGFIVGRTTGMNIMVLAEPVLDHKGAVTSVVFLSIDLVWIGRQMQQMAVPPGSNVALIDGAGTIMALYPHEPNSIGRKIPELAHFMKQRSTGHVDGVHIVGKDQVSRVYVSAALPGTPRGSAFIRAGIPTAETIAEANHALRRNLLAFAAVALLAFAAAWWLADFLVVTPTRRLIAAAEALGSGDMMARSRLKHGDDELGQLARHFDDMATRLQRLTRALRTLGAGNRALLRAVEKDILLEEMCRIAVVEGGFRLAWVAYAVRDERGAVALKLRAGSGGNLEQAIAQYGGSGAESAPALAIRSGSTQIVRSVIAGVDDANPPRRFAACALPLRSHGEVIGALTLYTEELTAFDQAELELLEEFAADLSFGIQTLRDRREHEAAAKKIRDMAFVDSLTGLPNRAQFELHCNRALEKVRNGDGHLAIIVVSLQRFTRIQNAIGFTEGDLLIVAVAHRLRDLTSPDCTVARLVSDRFAILLPGAEAAAALATVQRYAAAFEQPFAVAQIDVEIGANFGIAVSPEHGIDAALLIRRADIACSDAQISGTGIEPYHGESERESPERLQMMVDLRRAIDAEQLTVHYQGKVNLASGEVTGAEALARWTHATKGAVPPSLFIPNAEQTGLIKPLTQCILTMVLRQLHAWEQERCAVPVAVNLSARNFRDPALLDGLRDLLNRHQVPPRLLQIEITEGVLMEDVLVAQRVLEEMRALGLQILIDDFGTGYSSLRYLASLPVDGVKIDRSFIVEMEYRPQMHALVSAVIDMGHQLGLKVVAEGVEHPHQLDALRKIGCDEIQGYIYCKPQSAGDFRNWLARHRAIAPLTDQHR